MWVWQCKNKRYVELLRKNVGVHNSNQRIHRTWSRSVISPTPQTFKGCFIAACSPQEVHFLDAIWGWYFSPEDLKNFLKINGWKTIMFLLKYVPFFLVTFVHVIFWRGVSSKTPNLQLKIDYKKKTLFQFREVFPSSIGHYRRLMFLNRNLSFP